VHREGRSSDVTLVGRAELLLPIVTLFLDVPTPQAG
jgi:hypothetical protein